MTCAQFLFGNIDQDKRKAADYRNLVHLRDISPSQHLAHESYISYATDAQLAPFESLMAPLAQRTPLHHHAPHNKPPGKPKEKPVTFQLRD